MKYKSKGLLLFAYGKEGELYTRKWDMKALTKNLSSNSEKEDLFDGKEFLEDVRNKCIIDYDGSLEHIFVNGFESNLGLASNDFCQGKFLVMEDVFEELCEEYNIKVDWAGK